MKAPATPEGRVEDLGLACTQAACMLELILDMSSGAGATVTDALGGVIDFMRTIGVRAADLALEMSPDRQAQS